jgi:polyisoprenoid-binding protein YceI
MNKHLRKALKDKDFPEVRYEALQYTLVDNGGAVQTSGELTIAGVTKPVGFGAKLIPLPEGGTRVVGKVEINMRDYGVKPPSVFFGALKVADIVTVRFDTVVRLPHEVTQALFNSR